MPRYRERWAGSLESLAIGDDRGQIRGDRRRPALRSLCSNAWKAVARQRVTDTETADY